MDIEKIKKANTKYLGKQMQYYKELGSTQDKAKELVNLNVANGTIVITENQTKGKGTKGRTWYSSMGKNITMTIIIYPNCIIDKLDGITLRIAEIMQNVILKLYNIKLEIKLPNDLMLYNKKIAGILTETKILKNEVQQLLIGIGFNVNETEFSKETINIATSLKKEYNKEFSIEDIIISFIEELEKVLNYIT